MKLKKWLIISLCFILLIIILDDRPYLEKTIQIWELEGKIFIPKDNYNKKCFVFVHGDGPMNIDARWFYKTYFSEFAKNWYCSISWNKSQDYKNQTMIQRAGEVEQAIFELDNNIEVEKIILIWWSQSAWVMWYVDQKKIDWIIQISWAVDWISQGKYMTKTRAKIEKLPENKLKDELYSDDIFNEYLLSWLSYQEYLKTDNAQDIWKENWIFWQKNISEDIRNNYANITVPYLAIFWWKDAHVDTEFSRRIYPEILWKNTKVYQELFYPNGNHLILETSEKQFINKGTDLIKNIFKNEILWKYAYPDEYFENIIQFTKN